VHFASDNWAGAHPKIMAALIRANEGYAPSYGGDALTKRVEAQFAEVFERDVAVFFVATGGAANSLALSQLCPPWGMILAHEESHIQMDECGAPEFFTGGAKLLPIRGFAGKLTPAAVNAALAGFPERPPHGMPARALSLTQATECGTVYPVSEVSAFAAALSFGATKNGCLIAEAVVFFDPAAAKDFMFRRKRAAQLFSKMRFIAAQFDAYFDGGLWLDMAAHANAMARDLSGGLAAIPGVKVWYPAEANEVFVSFPPGVADKLRAAGATFYPWVTPGDPANGTMQRLICSWATTGEDVTEFLDATRRAH
jgi:threonine aldolase